MKKITNLCLSLLIAMTAAAEEWTLVTDASTLKAGDEIVLVCRSKGKVASTTISGTSSNKYMTAVTATFRGSELISIASEAAVFTLSGNASAWTLTSQEGKVLGATAAKKVAWDTSSATNTWTITNDGIASTNTSYGKIQYNEQGSARFTVYASSQTAIQIYRKGSLVPKVAIRFEGFPYMKTACDDPTFEVGSEYTLPAFVPYKNGKMLKAWKFEQNEYEPGASFIVPESDVLFVPVWEGGTAIDNTPVRVNATKFVRDGQMIIVLDGVEYNVLGERVK